MALPPWGPHAMAGSARRRWSSLDGVVDGPLSQDQGPWSIHPSSVHVPPIIVVSDVWSLASEQIGRPMIYTTLKDESGGGRDSTTTIGRQWAPLVRIPTIPRFLLTLGSASKSCIREDK
uniref:Uncharacterized protein n=1 Tax=Oryza sativa subsp. japonica TaxID=39947 RepID=Q2QQJ6_ORYSJ|nr:hypothetical protein LOC_Os12g30810 [Oryza sativa Japonica Group]